MEQQLFQIHTSRSGAQIVHLPDGRHIPCIIKTCVTQVDGGNVQYTAECTFSCFAYFENVKNAKYPPGAEVDYLRVDRDKNAVYFLGGEMFPVKHISPESDGRVTYRALPIAEITVLCRIVPSVSPELDEQILNENRALYADFSADISSLFDEYCQE